MSEGRKILERYENQIDNIIIDLCEPVSNLLIKFNITPNQITTVGMFVGIASFYCILKKRYKLAFILFWLSYYLDCLDGYYARKYNMVTTFGDYYDHVRDIVVTTLIIGAVWNRLPKKHRPTFVVIMVVLLAGLSVHIGCQEQNSNIDKHNDCLAMFKPLCADKRMIGVSKVFGFGTLMFIISMYILMLPTL